MKKYVLKVCLLGVDGVGKLALIERLVEGRFYGGKRPILDLGVIFYLKSYTKKEEEIQLQLWPMHQEVDILRYGLEGVMARTLLGTFGIVFVYDITNKQSFENVRKWVELYRKTKKKEEHEAATILVGCKKDLEEGKRSDKKEAEEYAKKSKITYVGESSAREGRKVEEVFERLKEEIKRKNKEIFKD